MLIQEAATALNLTSDDLRMSLVGVRDDWDTCQEITDAEYQLIGKGVQAALPESNGNGRAEITPVEGMGIEKQRTLVSNVAQLLGQELILSIEERIQIATAIDEITNQVILTNREASIRDLSQKIAQQDEAVKAEYIQVINTLQSLIKPEAEAPKRTGMDDFNKSIADIQKKLKR